MTFLRVKTVKGRRYLYKQTSVRKGKKVLSIMEYICSLGWITVAAASPGSPGGFSGNRSTDKRSIKHQALSDRELFTKRRWQRGRIPRVTFRRQSSPTSWIS